MMVRPDFRPTRIWFWVFLVISLSWSLLDRSEGQTVPNREILSKGLSRFSAGVLPFGSLANGQPNWPIPEPVVTSAPDATPVPAPANSPMEEALKADTSLPQDGAAKISEVKDDVKGNLKGAGTPAKSRLPLVKIPQFRQQLLLDCVRHARAVSEGKNEEALDISLKWNSIAHLYPDQIDSISENIASDLGFASFHDLISALVNADYIAVNNTPAPAFLTDGTTAAAPTLTGTGTGTGAGTSTLSPTQIAAIGSDIAEAINGVLTFSSKSPGELGAVTNSLDLEGPGAEAPVRKIIEDSTGNDPTKLKEVLDAANSPLLLEEVAKGMAQRIQQVQGGTISQQMMDVIKGLAGGIIKRMIREINEILAQ